MSCPHVEKMGTEIGDDHNLVHDIIQAIKRDTNKPLFVKVGLGKSDILEVAKIAENAGVSVITSSISTILIKFLSVDNSNNLLDVSDIT